MANAPLILTTAGKLKELPLVTTVGATGSDAAIPTEQAVREALSAHSHAYADITNKPTLYQLAAIHYAGNDASNRVLSFTPAVTPQVIILRRENQPCTLWTAASYGNAWSSASGAYIATAITVAAGSITWIGSDIVPYVNASGQYYTMLIWG